MGKSHSRGIQKTIESVTINHRIFIVGSVWVEPNSSAAGSRMLQLIEFFLSQKWTVSFGTTAAKNENSLDLKTLGVQEFFLALNSSSFDDLLKEVDPTMVLFDRFMMEEQFGWRVSEVCPYAIRILDTEDLHCLRKTRQEAVKKGVDFRKEDVLLSEIAKREIASIYRCDASLIISSFEMELLTDMFGIDAELLCYVPFFLESISEKEQQKWKSFEERHHFISIGNFLHPPNLDATIQLKKHIWPLIRKQLPQAELHSYGAYPTQQVAQMHDEKEGFFVHGFVEDAQKVIGESRVLLAPLRFGAGIKGKLTDAMLCGTPSVTTPIGAEGMHGNLAWNGFIESETVLFAEKAIQLYQEAAIWKAAQQNGVALVNQMYSRFEGEQALLKKIQLLQMNLEALRAKNFIGQMLQYHTVKSYKYLGKWIEEKNKHQSGS